MQEWASRQEDSLYYRLNAKFRSLNRDELREVLGVSLLAEEKPNSVGDGPSPAQLWKDYLLLLLSGLEALPAEQRTVYRGVRQGLLGKYEEVGEHIWYSPVAYSPVVNFSSMRD